jgi:hypothetical protein
VLDKELCFQQKDAQGQMGDVYLREIQLFAGKDIYQEIQQKKGQHICVVGDTWSADNAHHRTGILMTVKELKKIA